MFVECCVFDFGVTFDSMIKWRHQIQTIEAKAFKIFTRGYILFTVND